MPLDRNKIKCSLSQRPLLFLLWLYLFKINIKNINIWTFDLRLLHWSSSFFLLSLFSYFPFCPKPLLHSSVSLPPPFVHLLVMQSPPLPLSPFPSPSPSPSRSPCSSVLFFSTYFLHSSSSSFTFPCLLLTLSFLSCSPSPPPPPPLVFPPRRWDLPPGGVDHCL